jgi:lipopolysaccharide export system permease protein
MSCIDARRLEPLGGKLWRLVDGTRRDFAGSSSRLERFKEEEIELEEEVSAFKISKGRPEQMGIGELRTQIALRKNMGLPAERYLLAAHNKLAYPFAGLPGMLLACALALRPGRRGRLASVLAEGFLVIIGLWGLLVIFKAAAFAGYLSAPAAAWAPVVALSAVTAIALKRFVR